MSVWVEKVRGVIIGGDPSEYSKEYVNRNKVPIEMRYWDRSNNVGKS